MRVYQEEAPPDAALPQFAQRYERPNDARGRTPVDIIGDALSLLHQDSAEYAFAGLIGAIAAAFLALMLHTTGGYAGKALLVPAVFGASIIAYANACAAVRRAQENLQPDAARAFFAVIARLHAIAYPLLKPVGLCGAAVLIATVASRWAPGSVLTLAVIVVFVYAGWIAFQSSLYIPALFARDATPSSARELSDEMLKKAGVLVGSCFAIALAPAALFAMVGLASGFGPLSTAVTAFVLAACMPLAACSASIVYEALAPQLPAPARRRSDPAAAAEARRAQRVARRAR